LNHLLLKGGGDPENGRVCADHFKASFRKKRVEEVLLFLHFVEERGGRRKKRRDWSAPGHDSAGGERARRLFFERGEKEIGLLGKRKCRVTKLVREEGEEKLGEETDVRSRPLFCVSQGKGGEGRNPVYRARGDLGKRRKNVPGLSRP